MNEKSFGDDSRYYSSPRLPDRQVGITGDSPMESRIRHLLSSQKVETQSIVEKACKQANLAVREYLRDETALKISHPGRRQTVPFQVVDGLPRSLEQRLDQLPEDIFLFLLQSRHLLNQGHSALQLLDKNLHQVLQAFEAEDSGEKIGLNKSLKLIENVLDKINLIKLPELILNINEDVMGAYFYKIPAIQIYWMPIGLIAGALDITVDDLSFIVLAHELAHAYTHLGLDIDKIQWQTEMFANTNLMIVEGLAQFYTEGICKKLEPNNPGLLKAFYKLLDHQPPPYTNFREWADKHASEVVRFTLIATRSNNILKYDQFLNIMNDIEEKIPNHRGQYHRTNNVWQP